MEDTSKARAMSISTRDQTQSEFRDSQDKITRVVKTMLKLKYVCNVSVDKENVHLTISEIELQELCQAAFVTIVDTKMYREENNLDSKESY